MSRVNQVVWTWKILHIKIVDLTFRAISSQEKQQRWIAQ